MTDTPRVDAIAYRHNGVAMNRNEANAQYNDLLDLARTLERELAAAKKPPPCLHTQRNGQMVAGGEVKWWCAQCGKRMECGYVRVEAPWSWAWTANE